MAVGAVFKFLATGVGLIKGAVEGATRVGKTSLYFGSDISVALVAVGYIVGFNVALLIFIGGAIGWLFGIPIYYLFAGFPAGAENALDAMFATWNSHIRFMGVGAMVAGGVWSIIGVRKGIVKGIQGAIAGYKGMSGEGEGTEDRTQKDINIVSVLIMLVPTILMVFVLYIFLTKSVGIGLVAGFAMVITAFFFVAVSSYIVGLVGSSNNPVSGMTICTVLFASALLLLFGMRGESGILAALGVAGVVCCAACTAGDVSQDLKTGYLVGATPWRQQWAQIIGVVAPAFVIAPILTVLHSSYGIGVQVKEGVEYLKAPQAGLFAGITQAMFTPEKSLPWIMVVAGLLIGISIIAADEKLKRKGSSFRMYVMPVAVGIYLPWALSVPIMVGGLAALITGRIVGRDKEKESVHRGILVGSGLIAGEALMGIIIAFLIFLNVGLPKISLASGPQNVLSLVLLLGVIAWLMYVAVKGRTD